VGSKCPHSAFEETRLEGPRPYLIEETTPAVQCRCQAEGINGPAMPRDVPRSATKRRVRAWQNPRPYARIAAPPQVIRIGPERAFNPRHLPRSPRADLDDISRIYATAPAGSARVRPPPRRTSGNILPRQGLKSEDPNEGPAEC
jgi:hypothetical protein